MNKDLSREEIFAIVKEIVVACLACEPDEVTPEANFRHDLGGESIDDLDLMFRCERRFGFRIRFQDLQDSTLWQVDERGRLTPETLAKLSNMFPLINLSDLEDQERRFQPGDFLKIDRIVQIIEQAQSTAKTNKSVAIVDEVSSAAT